MPKTIHLQAADPADIERAAAILRGGGLVAFPTETVYGLGAHALSREAVEGIFRAKGRPSWDPLIVHVAGAEGVSRVAEVPAGPAAALAQMFWPGPLTLLLPRLGIVPDAVTAGRPLVGLRVPAHPAAQALLRAAGLPIAAPSANRFGHTSPTTAQHVLDDLDGRIDAVLDGGPCPVGLESSVVDPGTRPITIYRAGAITAEQIEQATGVAAALYEPVQAAEDAPAPSALPSPGVGLRHYAPEVPVQLTGETPDALWTAAEVLSGQGLRVGIMLPADWSVRLAAERVTVQRWGVWSEPAALAQALFSGLRALETRGVDVIVCPLPVRGGIRDAIRDRLMKAAKAR